MNAILKPTLYEQLMDLPEHVTGEILNGELHAMPRPSGKHAGASSSLGMRIGSPFRFGDGGPGVASPNAKYILFQLSGITLLLHPSLQPVKQSS